MTKLLSMLLALMGLCACSVGQAEPVSPPPSEPETSEQESTEQESTEQETPEPQEPEDTEAAPKAAKLKITVGEYELLATFEDNSSAEEFQALLAQGPITVEMDDYGGFEKVGPLGTELTRNDTQITTEPGDVILYQGNQITIYYGINTWNFTRLARIDDPDGLREKLGDGTVSVTFSLELEA